VPLLLSEPVKSPSKEREIREKPNKRRSSIATSNILHHCNISEAEITVDYHTNG